MEDAAIYKIDLEGKIVGKFGRAGKQLKEFGLVNSIDCRSENELFVGELSELELAGSEAHAEGRAVRRGQVGRVGLVGGQVGLRSWAGAALLRRCSQQPRHRSPLVMRPNLPLRTYPPTHLPHQPFLPTRLLRSEHRRRLRNRGAVVPRLRRPEMDAAGAAHHRLSIAEGAASRLNQLDLVAA